MLHPARCRGGATLAVLSLVALVGCDGTEAVPEDAPATQQAQVAANGFAFNGFAFNGFAFNGFAFNGFAFNGFAFNGLAANGFAFNGFAFNGLSPNGLDDAPTRALAEYVVSCALPAGDSVTFQSPSGSHTFAGAIGLAPQWKTKPCDGSCQRWISACLIARTNAAGEHVQISLRGLHPALAVSRDEARMYRDREAAYFGNLFGPAPVIYACLSPEENEIPRVCGAGEGNDHCPMPVVGRCTQVCAPGADGGYFACGPDPLWRSLRAGTLGDRYLETITVFLAGKGR